MTALRPTSNEATPRVRSRFVKFAERPGFQAAVRGCGDWAAAIGLRREGIGHCEQANRNVI